MSKPSYAGKHFPIEPILSVTTGRLMPPTTPDEENGMDDIYQHFSRNES